MSTPIIQQLGFDASGAIAQLAKLNQSLIGVDQSMVKLSADAKKFSASGLGRSLANAARGANKLQTAAAGSATSLASLVNTAGHANQGAVAMNKLTQNVNNAGAATSKLVASTGTLARVAGVQALLRGYAALSGQIREATERVVEFEKKAAEAATISGGQFNTEQLQASLRVDAKTFGLDVLDLATAKYQQFSNQVKDSTESTVFFNTAQKLAVATNTSATNSVDALSTALNSYGASADESERFANTLFKTIEQGRITLGELSTSMGRVSPLASQLGISFEEVGASLAVLTKSGNAPTVAVTQLRAVMNQLIKEGPGLKKVFKEMFDAEGVTDALEKAGGFIPLIAGIEKATKEGGVPAIAELLKNIRAVTGQLALTGQEGDLAAVLKKIEGGTQDLNTAFKTLNDTTAKEFERTQQELKVAFDELAESLVPIFSGLTKLTTGTVTLVNDGMLPLATGIGLVAGALALFKLQAIIAASATGTLWSALLPLLNNPVTITITAIATAAGLVASHMSRSAEEARNWVSEMNKARETADKFTGAAQRAAEAGQTVGRERLLANFQATMTTLADAQGLTRGLKDEMASFSELAGTQLHTSFSKTISEVERLKSHVRELQDIVNNSDRDLARIQDRIDDYDRARRKDGLSRGGQIAQGLREADAAIKQANQSIAKGGVQDLKDAMRVLEVAYSEAETARKKLQQSPRKAPTTRFNVGVGFENNVLNNMQKRAATSAREALRGIKAVRAKMTEVAAESATKSQSQIKAMEAGVKSVIGEVERLQEILSDPKRLFEHPAALAALKEIITTRIPALNAGLVEAGKDFGIALKTNNPVLSGELERRIDAIQKKINKIRTTPLRGAGGLSIETGEKLLAEQDVTTGRQNVIAGLNRELAILSLNGATVLSDIDESLKKLHLHNNRKGSISEIFSWDPQGSNNIKDDLKDITGALGIVAGFKFTNLQDMSFEDQENKLLVMKGHIERILKKARTGLDGKPLLNIADPKTARTLSELDHILAKVTTRLGAAKAVREATPDIARELDINPALVQNTITSIQNVSEAALRTNAALNQTTTIAPAAGNALNSQAAKAGNLATKAGHAADEYERLNRALSGSGGGGAVNRAAGGFLYRAAGGTAQGQDNIPAMLQRGEHVTNAKSANQFASQLQAMNAGIAPSSRAQTTTNNNMNVGDINISATSNPEATARQVVGRLKREFRRGTSSF